MQIPIELAGYFERNHFQRYPLVDIPQQFIDLRGSIINIADGQIGDVAIITSEPTAIRANHVHEKDWHLCYLISGNLRYLWQDENQGKQNSMTINPGELFFTPALVPHKVVAVEKSTFLSISRLSRISKNYEKDTYKLDSGFFE
jgi:uncharacterized RmlC-like cupin family protein